jgi:hypothetical protein
LEFLLGDFSGFLQEENIFFEFWLIGMCVDGKQE